MGGGIPTIEPPKPEPPTLTADAENLARLRRERNRLRRSGADLIINPAVPSANTAGDGLFIPGAGA